MFYVGPGLYGLRPRVWAAGVSYALGEVVTSPLDWEDYRRIAATGTDTVDPADDTTKYRAKSYTRVVEIAPPNLATGITTTMPSVSSTAAYSVAATTRTNVFSASGKGYCSLFTFVPAAAFQVGVRFEIEIDGRTVLNFVITTQANGAVPLISAGPTAASYGASDGIPIEFRRTMNVFVTTAAAAATGTIHHRTVSTG